MQLIHKNRRDHIFSAAFLALIALGVCSSCAREPSVNPPATTDQFTPVPTIELATSLKSPPRQPRPDLVLGAGSHGENDTFAYVADVGVDSRGNVYVLDLFLDEVKSFDFEGTFIRVLAKKGGGPKELKNPRLMVVGRDTIFVSGENLQAFDSTGAFIESSNPSLGYFLFASTLNYTEKGLVSGRWIRLDNQKQFRDDTLVLSRFDRGAFHPLLKLVERRYAFSSSNHNPRMLSAGVLAETAADGTIFVVPGDSFHIDIRSSDGHLVRRLLGHPKHVPIGKLDFDDHVRSEERLARDVARVEMNFHRTFANGPRVRFRPAIGALLPLDSANVLVERPDLSDRPYDTYSRGAVVEWDVVNTKTGVTNRYLLPAGFVPRVYTDCHVYGSALSYDDAPVVLRFRIGPKYSCAE